MRTRQALAGCVPGFVLDTPEFKAAEFQWLVSVADGMLDDAGVFGNVFDVFIGNFAPGDIVEVELPSRKLQQLYVWQLIDIGSYAHKVSSAGASWRLFPAWPPAARPRACSAVPRRGQRTASPAPRLLPVMTQHCSPIAPGTAVRGHACVAPPAWRSLAGTPCSARTAGCHWESRWPPELTRCWRCVAQVLLHGKLHPEKISNSNSKRLDARQVGRTPHGACACARGRSERWAGLMLG